MSDRLTENELAELERLIAEASPSPMAVRDDAVVFAGVIDIQEGDEGQQHVVGGQAAIAQFFEKRDADMYVEACRHLPALIEAARNLAKDPIIRCAFCGHIMPDGTPSHKHKALTDHAMICPEHPLGRQLWAEREAIKSLRIELATLTASLAAATAERDELQATFDLNYKADQRAIAAWHKAHPDRTDTWPDRADMVVWLMTERDAMRKVCEAAKGLVAHNDFEDWPRLAEHDEIAVMLNMGTIRATIAALDSLSAPAPAVDRREEGAKP